MQVARYKKKRSSYSILATPHCAQRERGSIIVWILIAIVLFAALSYAFSDGMRASETTISEEKARILASDIIDYGRTVKQAVQMLQINGCEDYEISFENTVVAGYTNTSAPTDDSCDVFEPEGAGLSWQTPDSDITSNPWYFQGEFEVENIGTSNMELLMSLTGMTQNTCEEINNRLGITNPSGPPTNDTFTTSTQFTAAYNDGGGSAIGDNGEESNFAGKMAACFDGPPSGTYHFYQVLIAR